MSKVSVIPNAVDTDVFRPPEPAKNKNQKNGLHFKTPRRRITVVIGSRLVYRKGIDLVACVVPKICQTKYGKNGDVEVDFIIAGKLF